MLRFLSVCLSLAGWLAGCGGSPRPNAGGQTGLAIGNADVDLAAVVDAARRFNDRPAVMAVRPLVAPDRHGRTQLGLTVRLHR